MSRGLNVSFIDDSIMTTLNRVHRHKDASTDILSFPAHTATSISPISRIEGGASWEASLHTTNSIILYLLTN